jgi:hypothetical protein
MFELKEEKVSKDSERQDYIYIYASTGGHHL